MRAMRLVNAVQPTTIPAEAGHGTAYPVPGNPFQTGSLSELPWNDLFGDVAPSITRSQAMTIPGVSRARGIIISLISDKPLVDYVQNASKADVQSEATPIQPTWLYRTPGWQGPYQRMLLTLDDHIFYGDSLWACTRGAAQAGLRPILQAWHVPYDAWRIDPIGRIEVLDQDGAFVPAQDDEVIYLPSSSDGLLTYAARTLRGAVALETAWVARIKNPIPALDLHETEETNWEQAERQQVVDDWAKARNDPNGSISSTPWNIEARVLGTVDPSLYIEGRNAIRLDIASFFQLPASLLDSTTATASLTYTTQESAQSSLDSLTVPYWSRPIEDRLSQDDVVPIGHVLRFNYAAAYTEPPGLIVTSGMGHPAIVDAATQILVDSPNATNVLPTKPTTAPTQGAPSA